MVGGGQYNTIDNNIFVACDISIHVDARGLQWRFWLMARTKLCSDGLNAVNYKEPPYSTRYPELATILENNPDMPWGTS